MCKVLLEMSMSIDGYVAGPDVGAESPTGRGGERLHDWMFAGRSSAEFDGVRADVRLVPSSATSSARATHLTYQLERAAVPQSR